MKYTSKELSKKLAENGCELESEMFWIKNRDVYNFPFPHKEWELVGKANAFDYLEIYPAYDILNDICVKYAKEFFGEEKDSGHKLVMKIGESEYPETNWTTINFHTINVVVLLQQNKIQEAEDYIWEHCKFNPKNR